jgi:hypothetical protein
MMYGLLRVPVPQVPAAKTPPAKTDKKEADMKTPMWGALVISAVIMSFMVGLGILFSGAAATAHPGDVAAQSSPAVMAVFVIVGLVVSIAVIASSVSEKPEEMKKDPPMPVKSKLGPRDWEPPQQ